MTKLSAILVLIVLALTACENTPRVDFLFGSGMECRVNDETVNIVIDSSWSPEESEVLLSSLESWSEAAGVSWNVSTADCSEQDPYAVDECIIRGGSIPSDARVSSAHITLYTETINNMSGDYFEDLRFNVLHELGHFLGIYNDADEDGSGVMKSRSGATEVTQDDVDLLMSECSES